MGIISNKLDIMAEKNWIRIFFKDQFAGFLEEEPGGSTCFTYDDDFLKTNKESIAINLPRAQRVHRYKDGLHPFFDNLVAEGWLAEIQAKTISCNKEDRFKLLMAFGQDCIGAISVDDPKPNYKYQINQKDLSKRFAAKSKASLSGVQPKLLAYKKGKKFYPADEENKSTYIAKLQGHYPLIIENEFLAMKACAELISPDNVAEVEITNLEEGVGKALLVKRFDRTKTGEKLHFEEFAQLLNIKSSDKYWADYQDIADFINKSDFCTKIDLEKLLRRILACILLGNTDSHLKNFAMFHAPRGLDLTPVYDMVFVNYYDMPEMALDFNGKQNMTLADIKAKHLRLLCENFALNQKVLDLAVKDFEEKLEKVFLLIDSYQDIDSGLRKKFKEHIQKRWNGSFKNLGKN